MVRYKSVTLIKDGLVSCQRLFCNAELAENQFADWLAQYCYAPGHKPTKLELSQALEDGYMDFYGGNVCIGEPEMP